MLHYTFQRSNKSFLDSLAPPKIHESYSGRSSPDCDLNKEDQVRVFVKQLLTALQYMHDRNQPHLDLRPEVVLLQDDHLCLADFGQNIHLRDGKINDSYITSPEFVAPEIVKGENAGIYSDMWSVGIMTFVLLGGVSPFLGDSDEETLLNVAEGKFDLQCKELSYVTNEGIDFLENLLVLDPMQRMTVNNALAHPWVSESSLLDAKLSSDCLREFKYRHKWLERRIFVQQTPTNSILEVEPSSVHQFSESHPIKQHLGNIAEPVAIYDYLNIKDQPRLIEPRFTYGNRLSPETESCLSPSTSSISLHKLPYPLALIDDINFGCNLYQTESEESINTLLFEEFNRARIEEGSKNSSPLDLGLVGVSKNSSNSSSPSMQNCGEDRKPLQPQEGGECPIGELLKKDLERKLKRAAEERTYREEKEFDSDLIPPLRLIKGEHRDIEEEIANRILSDISEENSFAGSIMSLNDLEPTQKLLTNNPKKRSSKSRSRSTTPMDNSLSEEIFTPVASPSILIDIDNDNDSPNAFFCEKGYNVPQEQLDPAFPVGAPLFLEGLDNQKLVISCDEERPTSRGTLSPGLRCRPGTKSPVLLSPGREHRMECVISTKRGKQRMTKPMTEEAHIHDDSDNPINKKQSVDVLFHDDDDFEALMAEAEKVKTDYREKRPKLSKEINDNELEKKATPLIDTSNNQPMKKRLTLEEELEKYRPKNYYKEEDEHVIQNDIDDYIWDSHYQIGPDTLLLASKGASFNARVRSYRTSLWGEGAPYVGVGILGFRNRDITVRERRRYTDLMKEESNNLKNFGVTEEWNKKVNLIHNKVRNINGSSTYIDKEQRGDVIFKQRLRDVYWHEGKGSFLFECQVTGEPKIDIVWKYNGSIIQNSDKNIIKNIDGYCSLEVIKPELHELGEYSCEAKNDKGFDKTSCRAYSGEPPGKPGRPEIELASDTEVLICWEMPEMCTTLEGVKYKLEVRPAGEKDHFAPWTTLSDSIDGEVCLVKHLSPQGIYQFRVSAKNGFGWGLFSLNSRIIKTHRRGVPKLQAELLKRDILITSVSIPNRPIVKRGSRSGGLCEILEESTEDTIESGNEDRDQNKLNVNVGISLLINEKISKRFQIEKEIFRGRFSIINNVSDCKNEGRNQCVAKRRLCTYENVPSASCEYENLKACQHENVVQLVAAYENDSIMTLVTERLYEDVFHRFCFLDIYNEESIVLTVRQIVSALHWIHYKGIVHLDIQPDNVMFVNKRSWFIKLIDFGSSKRLSDGPLKSSTIHQRIDWRAPEVIKGDNVSEKTDCFGMGLIAFTILSGFHPFSAINDKYEEISDAIINVKCDPNLIPVQASQEALRFATWALKKDPKRRISTSEALSDRWLSSDVGIVRRRENIKYNSSRLRKTADYIMRRVPNLNGNDMTPNELNF